MLKFSYPILFILLLIFPFFLILKKINIIKYPKLNLNLVHWKGTKPNISNFIKIMSIMFNIFFLFGISFMIIALTDPIIFKSEAVYSDTGNAIMFLIDISPSMAAKDSNEETRLNNAKKIIRKFVSKYPGDSFGISAFASSAALIIPTTLDHKTFLSRLDSLSVGELGDGTAIGMGLAVSALYLDKKKNNSSYIILLSDGENNTGEIHPKTAAEILIKKNIHFFVIGIGNSGYSQIEFTDKKTGKLYSGTLNSKFNSEELKKIAKYGNGKYSQANSFDILDERLSQISKQIPATQSTFNKMIEKKIYRIFLIISSIFFGLSISIKKIIMRSII